MVASSTQNYADQAVNLVNLSSERALPPAVLSPVGKAMEEVAASFDRFCLAAGIEALGKMMEKDAAQACGARHYTGRNSIRCSPRRKSGWVRGDGHDEFGRETLFS